MIVLYLFDRMLHNCWSCRSVVITADGIPGPRISQPFSIRRPYRSTSLIPPKKLQSKLIAQALRILNVILALLNPPPQKKFFFIIINFFLLNFCGDSIRWDYAFNRSHKPYALCVNLLGIILFTECFGLLYQTFDDCARWCSNINCV